MRAKIIDSYKACLIVVGFIAYVSSLKQHRTKSLQNLRLQRSIKLFVGETPSNGALSKMPQYLK
jgi:hypothetical protein